MKFFPGISTGCILLNWNFNQIYQDFFAEAFWLDMMTFSKHCMMFIATVVLEFWIFWSIVEDVSSIHLSLYAVRKILFCDLCFEFSRASMHVAINRTFTTDRLTALILNCVRLVQSMWSCWSEVIQVHLYPGWPDMQIILCTINCHIKKQPMVMPLVSCFFSMVIVWKVCES